VFKKALSAFGLIQPNVPGQSSPFLETAGLRRLPDRHGLLCVALFGRVCCGHLSFSRPSKGELVAQGAERISVGEGCGMRRG